MNNEISKAATLINNADALLITAGAGIGVDSGLPDFRGNEGFWKAYPPIAKLKISFAEMANPQWFRVDPELAWAFYGHRLNLYRKTIPHSGFRILKEIGESKRGGYFVFTSNVDGQFQKAGFAEERICEVHGSIHHLQCTKSCLDAIWSAQSSIVNVDMENFKAKAPLPKCRNCGALARPNILMFGDYGWNADRSREHEMRLGEWLKQLNKDKLSLVVVELGAGEMVTTVRSFSQQVADAYEAGLVRINPRDSDTDEAGIGIALGAREALEAIKTKIEM